MIYEQLSLFEKRVDIDCLINAWLHIGSFFAYGKARIYDQFTATDDIDKNAAFLKREYGIGGHSWEFDGNDLFVDYDGRGIRCYSFGIETSAKIDIRLNWHQVAKKIKQAVDSGEYITGEQYKRLKAEEKAEQEYWRKIGVD